MSVSREWYKKVRKELVQLEDRLDALSDEVNGRRVRVGPDLRPRDRRALDEVHKHLNEASTRLFNARERLHQLRFEKRE